VLSALENIGAQCQSKVLRDALEYYYEIVDLIPEEHEEYIAWDKQYNYNSTMANFDRLFNQCAPQIETELLENYLNDNENEFIEWMP
jgi:hypothetical protein